MKLTIEVELTDEEIRYIADTSVERAINNTLTVLRLSKHADRFGNTKDWKNLKPIVTRLWLHAQDSIFRAKVAK